MKFTIPGKLDGLNKYTNANRSNKYAGNKMKRDNELTVLIALRQAKLPKVTKYPINLEITWYEPNLKRDFDNIRSSVKFILDAMVKHGILENDSQKFITGITDKFSLDREKPRIEVEIKHE